MKNPVFWIHDILRRIRIRSWDSYNGLRIRIRFVNGFRDVKKKKIFLLILFCLLRTVGTFACWSGSGARSVQIITNNYGSRSWRSKNLQILQIRIRLRIWIRNTGKIPSVTHLVRTVMSSHNGPSANTVIVTLSLPFLSLYLSSLCVAITYFTYLAIGEEGVEPILTTVKYSCSGIKRHF